MRTTARDLMGEGGQAMGHKLRRVLQIPVTRSFPSLGKDFSTSESWLICLQDGHSVRNCLCLTVLLTPRTAQTAKHFNLLSTST